MTIYAEIHNHLLKFSYARERRNRRQVIQEMLLQKYGDGSPAFPVDKLSDFAEDWVSYDRIFRLVQQENPEVRGKDYDDGKALSQVKQLELGYQPGYHSMIRK